MESLSTQPESVVPAEVVPRVRLGIQKDGKTIEADKISPELQNAFSAKKIELEIKYPGTSR